MDSFVCREVVSVMDVKAFKTLGRSYGLFRDLHVVRSPDQILLVLKPINWINGFAKTVLLTFIWVSFLYYCWQLDPEPVAYLPCVVLGILVAAWTLYIPIIRHWLIKSPILAINSDSRTIQVSRLKKNFKLDDLYAICDVVGPDGDGLPCRCELQFAFTSQTGFDFVLISKSIRDIFGPIAQELADFASTQRLSVDILAGSIDTYFPSSTNKKQTNNGMDATGSVERV